MKRVDGVFRMRTCCDDIGNDGTNATIHPIAFLSSTPATQLANVDTQKEAILEMLRNRKLPVRCNEFSIHCCLEINSTNSR